ncbi:MAG: VirB3 family type IV secretion system protein [Pseudomonadales bacterium]
MADDVEPQGFRCPIHKSLINPILIAGIPRDVCLVLWTVGAAMGFGMQEMWVVPFFIVTHIGLALLTSKDPYFATVYLNALKAPRRLDP